MKMNIVKLAVPIALAAFIGYYIGTTHCRSNIRICTAGVNVVDSDSGAKLNPKVGMNGGLPCIIATEPNGNAYVVWVETGDKIRIPRVSTSLDGYETTNFPIKSIDIVKGTDTGTSLLPSLKTIKLKRANQRVDLTR